MARVNTWITHDVNFPGGWCLTCGENEDYLIARNVDTIEYVEFSLVAPA